MFEKKGEIQEHASAVYDLARDGDFIYSASGDKYVVKWNLKTLNQENFAIRCTTSPYSIDFANAPRHLWVGLASGDLHVIDVESKKEVKFFQQHKSGIFSIHHLALKNLMIVGDADGNLSIWDTIQLKLLLFLPINCEKIRKIESNSDDSLLVINGLDGYIRIFETTAFNEISTFKAHTDGACCAFFNPMNTSDSQLISGGKDGHINQWNWANEELLVSVPSHNFALYDFVCLSDGKQFASASRDKSIKIWDTETLQFLQKIDLKSGGHKHSVNSLLRLDEHSFASCSDDRKIIIWKKNSSLV